MEVHGYPWISMEIHGKSMEVHGSPWISMGSPWKSMDIYGYPWICMDIHGSPWKSMDIHGKPWKSMEVHGSPCISMDIHGYPWKSMDFHRFSWIFWDFRGNPRKSVVNFNRRSNWLKIVKNNFLRFLAFYPLISAFQASSCSPERTFRDLSIGIENSSFHAIWLGIEPFLCLANDRSLQDLAIGIK